MGHVLSPSWVVPPGKHLNSSTSYTSHVSEHVAPDALSHHFRQVGQFPLLTAERELALARKLEREDLAITRTLLRSPAGRRELLELAYALREGELKPEDVERNPGERAPSGRPLAARIERMVRPSASKEPVTMRFHPRAVLRVERSMHEALAGSPGNARLERTLRRLCEHRKRGEETTKEFVQANLRIVVTFARRYQGLPLVDLIQEGNLGLLRAVDKFDHRRGLRFSTYAAWWIRHALSRALSDQSKTIRLPVHLTGTLQRIRRTREMLERRWGREPTPEEIADHTGTGLEQVLRAIHVVAQPISLDAPVNHEGTELGELVADSASPRPDDVVASGELSAETQALLATLPAREAEILRLRYGVGGDTQRTLEEIGQRLSLSRERARQIEREALRKLRVACDARQLRAHLAG